MNRMGIVHVSLLIFILSLQTHALGKQKIRNILLSSSDFKFRLTWNPVKAKNSELGSSEVLYRVSAKVQMGIHKEIITYNPTKVNELEFTVGNKIMDKWIFNITAQIHDHVIGEGISRAYRGLTPPRAPASASPPLMSISRKCRDVNVTLKLPHRDYVLYYPKFIVKYYFGTSSNSTTEKEKKPKDYSDTVMFKLLASKTESICISALYQVQFGRKFRSAEKKVCAASDCISTTTNSTFDKQIRKPNEPGYFNVLIGVAVVAALITVASFIFLLKKYLWDQLKPEISELPQTTKHVIDETLEDQNEYTPSANVNAEEYVSKFVSKDDQVALLSPDEIRNSSENITCTQENDDLSCGTTTDDNSRQDAQGDDNERTSLKRGDYVTSASSERISSFDSAFSDYTPLKELLVNDAAANQEESSVPELKCNAEGYVKLPEDTTVEKETVYFVQPINF